MLTTVSSPSLRLGRLKLQQQHHLRIQTMDSSASLAGYRVVGLLTDWENGSSLMGQWFQEVVQHFIEVEDTMMEQ